MTTSTLPLFKFAHKDMDIGLSYPSSSLSNKDSSASENMSMNGFSRDMINAFKPDKSESSISGIISDYLGYFDSLAGEVLPKIAQFFQVLDEGTKSEQLAHTPCPKVEKERMLTFSPIKSLSHSTNTLKKVQVNQKGIKSFSRNLFSDCCNGNCICSNGGADWKLDENDSVKNRQNESDNRKTSEGKNKSFQNSFKVSVEEFNSTYNPAFLDSVVESSVNTDGNYQDYTTRTLNSFFHFSKVNFEEAVRQKVTKLLNASRKVLLLDLDETLIHSNWGVPRGNGRILQFYHQGQLYKFELFIRPWLNEFLTKMNQHFDIYLFTASRREYAYAVLDVIDPKRTFFKQIFCREDCINLMDKVFVKDLRLFKDIDYSSTVLVDNSMYAFANQLNNGILVNSFYGDEAEEDSDLLRLTCYLMEYIVPSNDVTEVNQSIFGFKNILKEVNRERQGKRVSREL